MKKGFTLIELSLSLLFVAILSLTVAFIINDMVASYRRGMTLKQINTVGGGLVDDMRAAIQGSSNRSVKEDCATVYGLKTGGNIETQNNLVETCKKDGARNFVSLTREGTIKGNKPFTAPVFGAFCTGTYTYIWNSGYFFAEKNNYHVDENIKTAEFKFNSTNDVEANEFCEKDGNVMTCKDFRLLKVKDESRTTCIAMAGSKYNDFNAGNLGNVFNITGTGVELDEAPIDLLRSDEANGGLALYNMNVYGPAESTTKNMLFYSVSFILGTIQGGANINKTGNFCATPDDYAIENFEYCAINKFNFAAKASGE